MTFNEIINEVLQDNFDPAKRTSATKWVVDRYAKIWGFAHWPIREAATVPIPISASAATVTIPVGPGSSVLLDPGQLFDEYGAELPYLPPDRFYEWTSDYAAAGTKAPVQTWTLVATGAAGVQIVLAPTPDHSATFTMNGWQGPVHRTLATPTVYAPGTLSDTNDLPWFPDDYDYLLVIGAKILGMRLTSDASWLGLSDEWTEGLDAMREALVPRAHSPVQYGRVELY